MNKLQNAEQSIELCRSLLAQLGQHEASMSLRGTELHNVNAARMALVLIQSTKVYGKIAGQAKEQAIQVLMDAIDSPAPYGDA